MANTSYYEIVMTREQALFACSGYLAKRKRLEKEWRIKLIQYNMDKTTGFIWLKRPKFKNVRECIKYLKTSTDGGLFSEYLWEECCLSGRFWKKQVLASRRSFLHSNYAGFREDTNPPVPVLLMSTDC